MGILGIVLGTSRDTTTRLVRPAAVVFTIASAALTALYYVYQVTPAFVSMLVVTILFATALAETRHGDSRVWR